MGLPFVLNVTSGCWVSHYRGGSGRASKKGLLDLWDHAYIAKPPSTAITAPVVNEAAGEAKNKAVAAISLLSHILLIGSFFIMSTMTLSLDHRTSLKGVLVKPGQMTFTLIL